MLTSNIYIEGTEKQSRNSQYSDSSPQGNSLPVIHNLSGLQNYPPIDSRDSGVRHVTNSVIANEDPQTIIENKI